MIETEEEVLSRNAPDAVVSSDITYYYAGSLRIAMRTGQGAYLLFSDHLGSSSVVVNQAGRVEQRGYYLPWGGNRAGRVSITDYGYTGQMREGDIYYYNARWYDPDIGRFMQADTIVPMASQGTQGFDRYAYVNNNPLRYTDPSGNSAFNEFLNGVALEFLSDMTFGMFDSLIVEKSDSQYFENGRNLGRVLAIAVDIAEIYYGGGLAAGSFTMIGGTGVLSLAGAGPTGGGTLVLGGAAVSAETIPLVAGSIMVAHGVGSILFAFSRDISGPTIPDTGMLGRNGPVIESKTLWKGEGKSRLDVENRAPGKRPGRIHYQDALSNTF
ncbi:MAG: RHS repeat-associated core domain-containing protein [Anaerolineaceae bacterium]